MCAVLALEVGWAVWTGRSIAAWLHSDQAAKMMELAELREHLQPILQILAKYHPLPERIAALIEVGLVCDLRGPSLPRLYRYIVR